LWGLTPCWGQSASEPLEPLTTKITVAERVETEAPAAVTTWRKEEIAAAAGVNLDDRLRMVPGFSLFRRTSSLAANPTTQGVSLRGLGSTGASRTLVLWDGVPVNDPFGGWVYWTRLAPEELERVEVSRGASTSVFGDRAMGGAVALFSREATARRWSGAYETGNLGTHQLSAGGAAGLGRGWWLSGHGRAFTTDGYYIVPEAARGAVDTRANVRFAGGALRLDHAGAHDRLFARVDLLAEERDNGTLAQNNSTGTGTAAAHYTRETGAGLWSALGYHSRVEYRASFSAIAAGRASERLTSLQSVPAEATGGALLWRGSGTAWNVMAGADVNRAEGVSIETLFPAGRREGGGHQTQHGLFAQADAAWKRTRWMGGLRRHMAGAREFWSPSAGATISAGAWRARASGYRAFRAPTLNELYREFRVGNAVTLANAALRPEALTGVEAGLDWRGERSQVSFTAFRNAMDGLITNVTLSSTPALITRQRDNAGQATAKGAEASVSHRWGRLRAEASWLMARTSFAGGAWLPQVPRQQASGQVQWLGERTWMAAGVRGSGLQFEDDLNRFRLPGYAVWHVSARHRFGARWWGTLAVENLFDREIVAGFSPTPLLGAPRLIRAGVRYEIF
jgi:outer membrane cobalamin receptor